MTPSASSVLHGVNRSGTEYACVNRTGVFDGPHDDASVRAMASWHVKAVRVPLNEDCWLGLHTSELKNSNYSGKNYRAAIDSYVKSLEKHSMTVILDLHWTDGGRCINDNKTAPFATCQKAMPDAAHAPAFWDSVGRHYRSHSKVVYDLFNEPVADRLKPAGNPWHCWSDGGPACPGAPFKVAGMATLVHHVRAQYAHNLIMIGGLSYANDLTGWLKYRPQGKVGGFPVGRIAASWHAYDSSWPCTKSQCWDAHIAPIARQVPLIVGEIGEGDCAHKFIDSLMGWLDRHHIGYLGWTWNSGADDNACRQRPALIKDYRGTPTAYGVGLRNHLRSVG